jgi:hypothetical protein
MDGSRIFDAYRRLATPDNGATTLREGAHGSADSPDFFV